MQASTDLRRATILTAAEAAFADRGYGGTPVRDLIARSGHSTTVFYARFSGKEAVLEALVGELLDQLIETASSVVTEATSLEEGFQLGVEALVEVIGSRRRLVAIALTEGLAQASVRTRLAQANAALASVLAAGLHARDHDDPEAGGWALVGALTLQVQRWAVFEDLATDDLPAALDRAAGALRHRRT